MVHTTHEPSTRSPYSGLLLWAQGIYYLVTGVWPLVSIDTFQMVTGPKTDLWLVRTVAVVIVAIAVALLVAARRRSASPEIVTLAVGAAVGLSTIDVIYVAGRVIDPIYLLDAAIQVILLAAWGLVLAWRSLGNAQFRVGPLRGTSRWPGA